MSTKNHYVNNDEFVKALIEYKQKLETNPEERVPEYIGTCIVDICTRFASRPNFYGYSYKEEMISDGIENCMRYLTNFDPAKSTNAFSYYTQVAFYAFLRRIAREKKESYIKHRMIQDMPFEYFEQQEHDDSEVSQNFMSYIQSNSGFDHESYEKKLGKRTKKLPLTPLEELMGDDNE